MNARAIVCGIALLSSGCGSARGGEEGSPAGAASGRPAFAWVDSLVEREALDRAVPAVAVAIVSDGRVVLERAWGVADRAANRPALTTTRFRIASLTKPFTSTLALQLADEGQIDLDAEVRDALDWLPPHYTGITLRQLLTHTSRVDRDLRTGNFDDPTEAEYRARVDTASLHGRPGSSWEYSNTGYTLLGWALAELAGRPLEELLAEHLFAPLRMSRAAYRVPAGADSTARPYEGEGGTPRPAPFVSGGFASGGLVMSIQDLARFAAALDRGEVLTGSQRERAWAPARLDDGSAVSFPMMGEPASYGMGWFLARFEGERLITHGGGISGFSSNFYYFPERRLAIAVLANVKGRDDGRAPVDPLAREIASRCLRQPACRDAEVRYP